MKHPMTHASSLAAEALTLAYDTVTVIDGVDLRIAPGRVTALVGPNACGKSTLLRGLSRLLPPRQGRVLLDGELIHRLPTRTVARRLALLPQHGDAPEGLTVRELATFGRHPHRGWLAVDSASDERIVTEAIAAVGLVPQADLPVDHLSGGQRQRAWLALALAQQADLLLLDEPTTFLDPAHQWEILTLVRALNRDQGRTVVMVLHDLNLAARFADQIAVIHRGRIVAVGTPVEVLTQERIAAVYGIQAEIRLEADGVPLVILRGLCDTPKEVP